MFAKLSIAAVLILSSPAMAFALQHRDAMPPNILFILADDLAYDAVGFMGNTRVETPNIDRLARQGTVFSHAFNSGAWNGAVCVASRRMLMTGRQVWRANAVDLQQVVTAGELWPQRMESVGYSTWFTGKWHVGENELARIAFQHTRHIRPGMPNQVEARYHRDFTPGQSDWSPADTRLGGYWSGGRHWSEVVADDAAGFLDELEVSGKLRPFFMMLAFNAPHDPRQAPQEFQDRYPFESIPVPANFLPEYPHDLEANRIRDEKLAPFPRTEYSIRVNRSEYYALISHMDVQIGRILDRLDQSRFADNTIVIFTADHGLACGQHGLLGKQNQYDHSIRVPWIISGPGIPSGQRIDDLIYLQDAMATSLDLAGAPRQDTDEFVSVMPRVRGETVEPRGVIHGCYTNAQRMVRTPTHKLIFYPQTGVELLFDIESDPLEMKNLASSPGSAKDLDKLRKILEQQQAGMNDPLLLAPENRFPE